MRTKGPVRGPARGSLAWLKREWYNAARDTVDGAPALPEAIVLGLAQLSYECQRLRTRVAALEAIQLAWTLGMVEVSGVHHLLECAKRGRPEAACTCGSLPGEPSARKRNRDGGGRAS